MIKIDHIMYITLDIKWENWGFIRTSDHTALNPIRLEYNYNSHEKLETKLQKQKLTSVNLGAMNFYN